MRITNALSQTYGAGSPYGHTVGVQPVPPVRKGQRDGVSPGIADDQPMEGELLRRHATVGGGAYADASALPQGYMARAAIAQYIGVAYASAVGSSYIDAYV